MTGVRPRDAGTVAKALARVRPDLADLIADTLDPAPLRWPEEIGRRDLFGLPDNITYLDWAYLGPVVASARKALAWGERRRMEPWRIERRDFFDEIESCRMLFGGLVGCSSDDVALVPSSSYGIATAASVIAQLPPGRIVVPAGEHYSNHYAWRRLGRAPGWGLVVVERERGQSWTDAMLSEITPGCAVLALPACHWADGALFDLPMLARAARDVGAAVVVDATQTVGGTPFDLTACAPDFLVVSAYKWLLGPYGLAFLYVAPAHQGAEPFEGHSYHRAGAEGRATSIEYTDDYLPGARRFNSGQRADPVNLPHAVAGLCQLLTWQAEAVGAVGHRLIDHTVALAHEAGLDAAPRGAWSTIVGLRRRDGWPSDLPARLVESEGLKISLRGDAVRVSPSVGNGLNDIDRLIRALGTYGLCGAALSE